MHDFGNGRISKIFLTRLRRLPRGIVAIVCAMVLPLGAADVFAASGPLTIDEFRGNDIWVVPPGVTKITVEAWGGGGGGANAYSENSGGGGAGGQYVRRELFVTPGTSYDIAVGAGGAAQKKGGSSSFGKTLVVARGGAFATLGSISPGAVGSTAGGVGDIVYPGGNGSAGRTYPSDQEGKKCQMLGHYGAGGGGAGSEGPGNNARDFSPGAARALHGGAGGAGLRSSGKGNPGEFAGGGGGGACNLLPFGAQDGGRGGNGLVLVSYQAPPIAITNAASDVTATSATLNGKVKAYQSAAKARFEFGPTVSYGTTIQASPATVPAGDATVAVSATVSGLTCGRTYHYRLVAENDIGTGEGADVSFLCILPVVVSMNTVSFNPATTNKSVSWQVIFNTPVSGVDLTDFALMQTGGAAGATLTGVTGSGTTYTVTANTGHSPSGSLGLNLVDNNSIASPYSPLGGPKQGDGNFTGELYNLIPTPCDGSSDIIYCDDFERSNPGSVSNGWTVSPTSTTASCKGVTGNAGCAGIDADVPPFSTYSNPRANRSRALFTRWSAVSVSSPGIDLTVTAGAQLSFWLRRGNTDFSACPVGAAQNLQVQYLANDQKWKVLTHYPGSSSTDLCDLKVFEPTIELPADALHSAFQVRFVQLAGRGSSGAVGASGVLGYDYWHVDDVVVRKSPAPKYVGAFCDDFEHGLERWSITSEGYASGNAGDASIGSLAYNSPNHELDMRWGYIAATTFRTDLRGIPGSIKLWLKSGSGTRAPASGENLLVEYWSSSGSWVRLASINGTVKPGNVVPVSYPLPEDAKHEGFRLRLRLIAGRGYDKSYWHIDDVCIGAVADLALTKTGDATVFPGRNISYTLVASNNGPDETSGEFQVVDTLPAGLSYRSASGSGWQCEAKGQVVTCKWSGSLASGAKAPDLNLTASAGATLTGSVTNIAVLSGPGTDLYPLNNSASFTSRDFIPAFIFTNGICVDGIALRAPGQRCAEVYWGSMVAGRAKTGIYVTAVSTDGIPTKLNATASTDVAMQFGLTCHDPVGNAGVAATFSAAPGSGSLPLCTPSGATPTSWSDASNLTFAAGAPTATVTTPFTFNYTDVGKIELFMRDSASIKKMGSSASFVVKPAGFVLSEIKCSSNTSCVSSSGNNPAASSATGEIFIRSGQPFSATVKAINASGAATPNFGKEFSPEGVKLNVNLVLPASGNTPALNSSSDFPAFTSGESTGTSFSWPEVGIVTLTPSVADGDYLGTGDDILGTRSANVGRFIPDHFETTVVSSSGVPMPCPTNLTCPTDYDGFVYSGQPFGFEVSAVDANGNRTQNYAGAFARQVTLTALDELGGSPISTGTLSLTSLAARDFTAGRNAALSMPAFTFSPAPTAPTNVHIRAIDTDGVSSLRSPAVNSVEGGVTVVSGRIKFPNMYGSELLPLPMLATVQYFDRNGHWVTSTTDSASTFAVGTPTIVVGPLRQSQLTSTVAADSCTEPSKFCAGLKTVRWRSANTFGSVNIPLATPAFFPASSARATFGIYKSPLIYRRENY